MAVKAGKRIPTILIGALVAAGVWSVLRSLGFDDIFGVNPPRWDWLVLALGAAVGLIDRVNWLAIGGMALVALLLAVQWLPYPAALARRYVRNDSLPARPVDAIVVLSGSVDDDGSLGQIVVDRLLEGIRLHRKGVSNHLVLSRVSSRAGGRGAANSDRDQRAILATAGVTPELHVLSPVGSTHDEAERTEELAKANGWKSVVVVTSPTHTRRACATFEAVGLAVTCRASPDRRIAWSKLSSPSDRTVAFGEWMYESLGWWKYRFRGWVRAD